MFVIVVEFDVGDDNFYDSNGNKIYKNDIKKILLDCYKKVFEMLIKIIFFIDFYF